MSERQQTWLAEPRNGAPCTVIAEVAQAHDGSLGAAHAFIDAAAAAGADAIKFQTHIASAESTLHEPWRVRFSKQDETRYDYWKRMEFTPGQWAELKHHADDAGVMFLSSAFSLEAVDDGTRLTFVQTGVPEESFEQIDQGWQTYYWPKMKQMLES